MDGPCTCFAHVFPLKHRSEQSGVFVPPFWISQLSINENVVSFLHSTCIVECKNPTPSAIVWADLSQKGVQKRHFLCHRKSHFSLANSSSTMPRKQGLGRKHKKGTGIYRDERQLHTHTQHPADYDYNRWWRQRRYAIRPTMARMNINDDDDEEDDYGWWWGQQQRRGGWLRPTTMRITVTDGEEDYRRWQHQW
jgi:hypothetical protein